MAKTYKSTFCHYKWLILDAYNLPLSTGNLGLQKCAICFCAKHKQGVQISIKKKELRAALSRLNFVQRVDEN